MAALHVGAVPNFETAVGNRASVVWRYQDAALAICECSGNASDCCGDDREAGGGSFVEHLRLPLSEGDVDEHGRLFVELEEVVTVQSAGEYDDVFKRLRSHLSSELAGQRSRSRHYQLPWAGSSELLRYVDQEHGILLWVESACDEGLVTAGPRPREHISDRDEILRSHQ